jgi:ATP-dependent Clp protease protease subunit
VWYREGHWNTGDTPGGAVAEDEKTDSEKTDKMKTPIGRYLFDSRQVTLFGPIDNELATKVIAQLLALEADDPEAPITMLVNSPGGSVTDGFAIYDMMRFIQPEVRVVVTGLAASAATIVLLGAPKEHRVATPFSKLLIHQIYLPSVVRGQATDLEITAKDLMKTRDRINQLYQKETGQPIERIEKDTNRDYWMDAPEAVEYGLIARIVEGRGDL